MGLTEKNGIDREKWENKIDSETRARQNCVHATFSDSFPGIETIESAETYETKIERPTLLV